MLSSDKKQYVTAHDKNKKFVPILDLNKLNAIGFNQDINYYNDDISESPFHSTNNI
jgi:hypothetical protein